MRKSGVNGIIGAPLNYGFLADRGRFNYGHDIPAGMAAKLMVLEEVASEFHVDVRTAALPFSSAPNEVGTIIPATGNAIYAIKNIWSMWKKSLTNSGQNLRKEESSGSRALFRKLKSS